MVAVYEAWQPLDPLAEAPSLIRGYAARRLFVQGYSTDHRLTSSWMHDTQATIARPKCRGIPNKGELRRILLPRTPVSREPGVDHSLRSERPIYMPTPCEPRATSRKTPASCRCPDPRQAP